MTSSRLPLGLLLIASGCWLYGGCASAAKNPFLSSRTDERRIEDESAPVHSRSPAKASPTGGHSRWSPKTPAVADAAGSGQSNPSAKATGTAAAAELASAGKKSPGGHSGGNPSAGGLNAPKPGQKTGTSHDVQTLAYIDQELSDAAPDEREALFRELKGVPPDMVRQILKVRRMGMNFQQQQRLASQQQSGGQSGDPASVGGSGVTPTGRDVAAGSSGQDEYARTASVAEVAASGRGPNPTGPRTLGQNPWDRRPVEQVTAGAIGDGPTDSARPTQVGYRPGAVGPAGAADNGQAARFAPQTAQFENSDAVDGDPNNPLSGIGLAAHRESAAQQNTSSPLPNPQSGAAAAGTGSELVPGRYSLSTAAGQIPGVANMQRAIQDIPRPRLPWSGSAPIGSDGSAGGQAGDGSPYPGESGRQPLPVATTSAEELERLIALSEREVAELKLGDSPESRQSYVEKHVQLRMMYLMSGQQERALQVIPGLDPADQEFWQQTFWGLSNYFDTVNLPKESDRAAQTIQQLTAATMRLQQKAPLALRHAGFCKRINSFGSYEKFPREEFSAGQPVLLYCEIENFHSETTADGQHRTLLKSTLEIYKPGPQGELLDRFEFPVTEDLCQMHRRDYYHSYELTIPAKLALGPHLLKLTVEDQLTRKVATTTLKFTVK